MPTYLTSYPCGGATFGSYVVARDRKHLRDLILKRGLREKFIGYRRGKPDEMSAAEFYRRGDKLKCAHTLCFVGNVLCNAGLMRREDLMDDRGLLHEVIHQMEDDGKGDSSYLIEPAVMLVMLEEFDKKARKVGF